MYTCSKTSMTFCDPACRSFDLINPRPGRAFSITRPGREGGCDPPGVSKLSVVALCEKDQSIALDEYSPIDCSRRVLAIGGVFFYPR